MFLEESQSSQNGRTPDFCDCCFLLASDKGFSNGQGVAGNFSEVSFQDFVWGLGEVPHANCTVH